MASLDPNGDNLPLIVDELLKELDIKYPVCGFDIGSGWLPMVKACLEEMIAAGWDKDLHQVKEKFGGLRIYIGGGDDKIYDIIDKYTRMCWETCEWCGDLGELDDSCGWWLTLCTSCREKRKKEREEEDKKWRKIEKERAKKGKPTL